jgi:hypothetical protein
MYNKYIATNKLLLSQTLTHKENNMSNAFETPKLPEVKFNKNGYEIRTDILGMAKSLVQDDFSAKFQGWELTAVRDEKTGQIVSTVAMPTFPGLDKVLETAEKMYSFVNQGSTTKK